MCIKTISIEKNVYIYIARFSLGDSTKSKKTLASVMVLYVKSRLLKDTVLFTFYYF